MRAPELRSHVVAVDRVQDEALEHSHRMLGECDRLPLEGRSVVAGLHVDIVHGKERVRVVARHFRAHFHVMNPTFWQVPRYRPGILKMPIAEEVQLRGFPYETRENLPRGDANGVPRIVTKLLVQEGLATTLP